MNRIDCVMMILLPFLAPITMRAVLLKAVVFFMIHGDWALVPLALVGGLCLAAELIFCGVAVAGVLAWRESR